jgi:hypothetical protein
MKREEVTVDWRELLNEKLHDLYSSKDYLYGVCMWEGGGGRPLGRPRCRYEDVLKWVMK